MQKMKGIAVGVALMIMLCGCVSSEKVDNISEASKELQMEPQESVLEQIPEPTAEPTPKPTPEPTPEPVHEHTMVMISNGDGTHSPACSDCDYVESGTEPCTFEHYECIACDAILPWEQDIVYFDGKAFWDKGVFYAQKELNIYRCPDEESEVVGTLTVNESVNCVGRIVLGKGKDLKQFWVTEDGRCIPNNRDNASNRYDLREGTTDQVVVKYMTLSGDTWSPLRMHKVYDSFDEALKDLCGTTWTQVKSNWTYNDYKSAGQVFMNSYSEGASGKTVSTNNLVDPYSYTYGGNISYYFE